MLWAFLALSFFDAEVSVSVSDFLKHSFMELFATLDLTSQRSLMKYQFIINTYIHKRKNSQTKGKHFLDLHLLMFG